MHLLKRAFPLTTRVVGDHALEILIAGVDLLRFHVEIDRPEHARLRSSYAALRTKREKLRADLEAFKAAGMSPECLEIHDILEELDSVAHAIDHLRADVLGSRHDRLAATSLAA